MVIWHKQQSPADAIRTVNPEDRAKKAAELFRQAAEQGDAESQYRLGLLYQEGRVVQRDSDLAAKWFRKAAEQGHAKAQGKLGHADKQVVRPQEMTAKVSAKPNASAVQKSPAALRPGVGEFLFDVYEHPGGAREVVKKGFSWGLLPPCFFSRRSWRLWWALHFRLAFSLWLCCCRRLSQSLPDKRHMFSRARVCRSTGISTRALWSRVL